MDGIGMENNTLDKRRNATSSWSGYIHQGKVGFLVALRELKKCISEGQLDIKKYKLCYENAEDFDIIDCNKEIISRHQVKAYKDGNEREKYSTLFCVQTRNLDTGGIEKEGFQIHKFDEQGNILKLEVNENSRFIHVIVDVPDFNISKDEYLNKYNRRSKYTCNQSKIQLYDYSTTERFCPLSVSADDDKIKEYCMDEIQEILFLLESSLNENARHIEQVYYKYVASILDNSIGAAHNDSAYPTITFGDLLSLLTTEIPDDDIYQTKNNLIYAWDEYKEDFEEDSTEEIINLMDGLIKNLLKKNKEDFEKIVRRMAPHEKLNKPLSHVLNVIVLKEILFHLFAELKGFDCDSITYFDKDETSYRVSLIMIQNTQAKIAKVIEKIINNKDFLNKSFNNRFLINDKVSGIFIDETINSPSIITNDHTHYKKEWNTGVKDNIFNMDMEFIDIDKAIQRLKEE